MIANDNDPVWRNPALEIIDYKTYVRERMAKDVPEFARPVQPPMPAPATRENQAQSVKNTPKKKRPKNVALLPWIAAIAVAIMAFVMPVGSLVKIAASLGVSLTGAWAGNLALKSKQPQLSELANLSAVAGGIGALFGLNTLLEQPISPSDGLGMVAVGCLIFSGLVRSPICLIASICASMLWASLGFLGAVPHSIAFIAFPIIAAVHLYYASEFKSGVAVFAASATAYVWLIGYGLHFVAQGAISPLMGAGALFMAGFTQYRWGKAFEDEISYGSRIHTYFGWVAAVIGALFVQHYWLFPDSAIWLNTQSSNLGTMGWNLGIVGALAAIYLSGLVRWKHKRLSKRSALLMVFIAALLPASIWASPILKSMLSTIPGLYASPTIGLLIAGAVLASGIGFALNGVRRDSTAMIVVAMLAIGAQVVMLLSPALITLENIIIFAASLITSLAVGGLIAGRNLVKLDPYPGSMPTPKAA